MSDQQIDKKKPLSISSVFYSLLSICLSALAAFILFGIILRVVIVSGSSMYPTLKNGDVIIIQQVFRSFSPGDIVVVHTDQSLDESGSESDSFIIKRIIGCPGDVLNINLVTNEVIKNGTILEENYVYNDQSSDQALSEINSEIASDSWVEFIVPEDCFFVMGDNRNNSLDSRSSVIGYVSESEILGEKLFVF